MPTQSLGFPQRAIKGPTTCVDVRHLFGDPGGGSCQTDKGLDTQPVVSTGCCRMDPHVSHESYMGLWQQQRAQPQGTSSHKDHEQVNRQPQPEQNRRLDQDRNSIPQQKPPKTWSKTIVLNSLTLVSISNSFIFFFLLIFLKPFPRRHLSGPDPEIM